ncbi:MAG: GxxExxY protein [Desulfobacteraceae bacterium]|nr:MAG: GxxExxY protein [Desulfobacteraceae bacterium]
MEHGLKEKDLTGRIIRAALAVHRHLGPGFLESIYEEALCIEFDAVGIQFERQKAIPLTYRGKQIGEHRLDLWVGGTVVVELKAVSGLEKIHFAIVRSYMKAVGSDVGLLLNFATMPLTVKRVGREYNAILGLESGNQEIEGGQRRGEC